ncbi:MAG: Asp-tRNA(Asn)/Glu-tRNA(Gln) amidotransferase subunit GatC [Chlamydiales bacterium]|nr:Asp-tRNA(Asn)/Glu-tRNA(Gln) amidotransferase subunit GatC [Chlamydiales bacterium]
MSDLCKENVETLSKLCRIELTGAELEEIVKDLGRILDYIEQLREVDTNRLAPYSHADEQGVESLRDDAVSDQLPRDLFLSNAPDQVGGMIRVPPVIKQNP